MNPNVADTTEQREERSVGAAPTRTTPLTTLASGAGLPSLVLVAVVLVATVILAPNFFEIPNLTNVTRQASIVGVVAVGMTFVILTGGIDLSVGSIIAAVGVSSAVLANSGVPPWVAMLGGLVIGLTIGIVSGLGVTLLNIPPFIMTLAMLVVVRGVALKISGGSPKSFMSDSAWWSFFGSGRIGPVPGPLIIFLIVATTAWVVLRYTPFGRKVYAIGGNIEVARLAGVRVDRVRVAVYGISGVTAAIAGVMTTAQLSVGAPTAGNLAELEAIAAVVIGGTSLMGGVGGVLGTVLGALLLAVLANLLNLLGVGPFDQQIVRGIIIVVAVIITSTSLRLRFKRQG
ncbi:ribose transport system permease protein [Paenarthrobacter nicotinovorans]|jgi:ribose transport system permease protein|uniref:Ribose transport system permease protein n=1 Tax=Paenarthrobacter nicotinovorans TaxID=29320 RepID=A0ABT9TPS8_PAENI|nr:ABC transporter permease [Paenarthrobacter nicotinovorans]MDQ0103076.1 ribose transport system permease protein [Paenarthrobacter nicotinovorans]GAT88404.1 ribose ABC transporter permease [Paenarthrobacter nicotinovorans]